MNPITFMHVQTVSYPNTPHTHTHHTHIPIYACTDSLIPKHTTHTHTQTQQTHTHSHSHTHTQTRTPKRPTHPHPRTHTHTHTHTHSHSLPSHTESFLFPVASHQHKWVCVCG